MPRDAVSRTANLGTVGKCIYLVYNLLTVSPFWQSLSVISVLLTQVRAALNSVWMSVKALVEGDNCFHRLKVTFDKSKLATIYSRCINILLTEDSCICFPNKFLLIIVTIHNMTRLNDCL